MSETKILLRAIACGIGFVGLGSYVVWSSDNPAGPVLVAIAAVIYFITKINGD